MPPVEPPPSRPTAPAAPVPPPRGRLVRRAKRLALALSVLVLALAVAGTGLYQHYLGKITSIDVFGALDDRPAGLDEGAKTFLLVGSDSRFGLSDDDRKKYTTGSDVGERADTMILVQLSAKRDKALLVSLPRDSWVTIPEHRRDDGSVVAAQKAKLNSAYAEGGPALTVSTVEQATGLRIDHYLEVNFVGFARMVDALGGVDVCVPKPVDDEKSGLKLPAGTTRVDGVQGLAYVRARKSLGDGSDLGRIERQQQFLGAMLRRASSAGVLLNPLKLNGFLSAATESLRTDPGLGGGELRDLAMRLRNIDPAKVGFVTIPFSDANYRTPDGQSALLWDEPKAAALFAAVRADDEVEEKPKESPKPSLPPEQVTVEVVNTVGAKGLAGQVSGALQARGFGVADPTDGPAPKSGVTEIRFAPGQEAAARSVAAAAKGAKTVETPGLDVVQLVIAPGFSGVDGVGAVPAPDKSATADTPTRTAATVSCE